MAASVGETASRDRRDGPDADGADATGTCAGGWNLNVVVGMEGLIRRKR
jgi:hypothetical protein